jgi:chorismate lyase/3-hydroxybenzoate synthase
MAEVSNNPPIEPRVIPVDALTPPAWVRQLFAEGATTEESTDCEGLQIRVVVAEDFRYVQVVLPDALALESREFERRVTRVYAAARDQLERHRACHPLRFWNFIPGIHEPAHDGMDRYEVFNAGRFAAFEDWYHTSSFGPRMIAASGVGHHHPDLVIQVLAAERPGHGLENPRQQAAYRYSRRYGPRPPCFARATAVESLAGGPSTLIVAGTASVVGEDSVHQDDLGKQMDETCTNLEHLIAVADPGDGEPRDLLSRFRELRVYLVEGASQALLVDAITARFSRLETLELMPADLCRSDLLVEVEGVVTL